MSLANIKLKGQQRGFTIVELLIVVVVIAILAAITIVSYNGITSRANESAIKAQAATYQKKAELYQSEVGYYPVATTGFSSDSTKSYYIPADALVTYSHDTSTLVNDSSATKRLVIQKCAATGYTTGGQSGITSSNITGLKINYYNMKTPAIESISVGNTAVCPTTAS